MTTIEALAWLKALDEGATGAPWNYEDERYSAKCVIGLKPHDDRWVAHCQPALNGEANGALIAHVRNVLPQLIEVVRTAQMLVDGRAIDHEENELLMGDALTALAAAVEKESK